MKTGIKVDWSSIKQRTNRRPPDGTYQMKCLSFEDRKTQKGEAPGKLMVTVEFEITKAGKHGESFVRHHKWENFVLGTKEDLAAKRPETMEDNFAAQRLRDLLDALRAPKVTSLDTRCKKAIGKECVIKLQTDPKDDQWQNCVDYFEKGERVLQVTDKDFLAAMTSGKNGNGRTVEDEDDEEDFEDEVDEVEDEDEDEDEDEEEEEEAPVAKRSRRKKSSKRLALTECKMCGEEFPETEISEHIEEEHPDE